MTTPTLNLIKQAKLMEEVLDNDRQHLLSSYGYDRDKDARITLYSKTILVQRAVRLCLIFRKNHLTEADWWRALDPDISWILPSSLTSLDDLLSHYVDEFMCFTTVGYVHTLFSSIESSFRIFVRALDSSACDNGTAEFKNIYEWLLVRLDLRNWICLFHMFRLMRNTIHNNGVYYHRKNIKEVVTYRGNTYTFESGKPVEYEYGDAWDLLLFQIMPDLRQVFSDITSKQDILDIPQIIDPFVQV